MSDAPLVRLVGAAFGYSGRDVVRDVNLEIRARDRLGIVGPNGAGKTTLFRGLLGLIPARLGSVWRDGSPVGYVPQREELDPLYPLQVREVVLQGAAGRLRPFRPLPRREREAAREALAYVGLVEREREPFASLSGGQRQRVLIARALMARPRLLCLDEPTSGVDRAAQERILELLERLGREEGLAVLLVSHQLALLREAVDHVLVVRSGRVERGLAAEILAPAALEDLFAPARAEGGA